MASETETSIRQLYSGRTVLVTGATGFMGKVLIEKLLRSTEVALIYMVVRPKKGKSVAQRTKEYFDDVVFSKVRSQPGLERRVRAVEGDAALPGMGLSTQDRRMLQDEVEMVFHGAATVRFDEALERAVAINVRGTRECLQLARECRNLKAFVHISTAYANCTQPEIYEDFFEPPLTGDNAIALTHCLSDRQTASIAHTICGEYPNTYAFTKAVAENVVKVYGQGLPVVVFRPAIVVATAHEPIKGWIDNVYGPTGVQVGFGAGVIRTFQVDVDCVAELVPVDMAVNSIIASAWDIVLNRSQEDMPVYNYVSSCQKPLLWSQFMEMSLRHGHRAPTVKSIWYYTISLSKFTPVYLFYQFFLHLLPALLVDTVLILSGNKPKLWTAYKKIHKFSKVITYFSLRQWRFHNSNVVSLWEKMSEEDRRDFNFDMTTLDWDQFFGDTIDGIRQNFFKDTPDTIPAAKRRQLCFFVLHQLFKVLLVAVLYWIVWNAYSLTQRITIDY